MSELLVRVLPDGRGCWVFPIGYGKARMGIGRIGSPNMDDLW